MGKTKKELRADLRCMTADRDWFAKAWRHVAAERHELQKKLDEAAAAEWWKGPAVIHDTTWPKGPAPRTIAVAILPTNEEDEQLIDDFMRQRTQPKGANDGN